MTNLFSTTQKDFGPVECLGQTFPSEQARREHFTKLLAEKLKDPAFRKIEGFPQGTDEAILAMSDPPYYTACPNPFLEDFVRHYGKPYDPSVKYSREPQTIDVSVGKTDPLYKAHSYHTKVPHLAIVPSILHYTEPGDIVLDGFGGSGMTGVAAQWCGLAQRPTGMNWRWNGKSKAKPAPKWGHVAPSSMTCRQPPPSLAPTTTCRSMWKPLPKRASNCSKKWNTKLAGCTKRPHRRQDQGAD